MATREGQMIDESTPQRIALETDTFGPGAGGMGVEGGVDVTHS
jgi:hypothetical protein